MQFRSVCQFYLNSSCFKKLDDDLLLGGSHGLMQHSHTKFQRRQQCLVLDLRKVGRQVALSNLQEKFSICCKAAVLQGKVSSTKYMCSSQA